MISGERVAALGASLKRHYDERAGARTDSGGEDLDDAARRFARAVQDAADSLGAATRDPAVTEDARRVGTSFAEALSVTFAEVSGDLHRMAQSGSDATTDRPSAAGTDTSDTAEAAEHDPGANPDAPAPEEQKQRPEPWVEPWGTP